MKRLIFRTSFIISILLLLNSAFAAPNYQVYQAAPYLQNNVVKQSQTEVIQIVIDYSRSMSNWIGIAKSTLQSILPQIPEGTEVGLRVFGQKLYTNTVNSNNLLTNINHSLFSAVGGYGNVCSATAQVVPISKLNRNSLINGMNSVQIGSATPLTLALEQTVYSDFASKNLTQTKKIILITDGGESCEKNPCAFVRRLMRARNDIKIDVIMINGTNKLKCLSDATGGNFYKVNSYQDFGVAFGVAMETKPQNTVINSNTQNNYQNYVVPMPQGNVRNYQFLPE